MRLIALCTQANEQVQQAVANDHKRKLFDSILLNTSRSPSCLVLSLIYEQLLNSENSLLIGNASLVFGHVIIHPSARSFLRKSSGIEITMAQMLKVVEEPWLTKPARKNVAIFITKLVKADEKYESHQLRYLLLNPFHLVFYKNFEINTARKSFILL